MAVNGLLSVTSTARDNLQNDGYTRSKNANRLAQEMLKNRIDAINNNGPVVPVTPSYTCPSTSYTGLSHTATVTSISDNPD